MIAGHARVDGRVLITLDLDFGNVRAYPPADHAGIIVLRPRRQDKTAILALTYRTAMALINRLPVGELWIVEPDRIRFRTGK